MNRKIQCAITGNKYTFNVDYYNKKVSEYGDDESLKKNFLTKKAKTYISRGYSATEIRTLLSITNDDLLDAESPEMKSIIEFHNIKANSKSNRVAKAVNFAKHKSDPEVIEFIENISKYR
tara:strand:+ start:86 stop:445 length:360 start_codon:yes stop_codon:yes gene_type:complete